VLEEAQTTLENAESSGKIDNYQVATENKNARAQNGENTKIEKQIELNNDEPHHHCQFDSARV
jgi:hypothetical protein